jgi:hypothetical protein
VAIDWIGYQLRRGASIGLALAMTMIAMTTWLASRPPAANCSDGTLPGPNRHVILASKVVVHPWYGPHHAYGIFLIPDQYRDKRYSATVTVLGVREPTALPESSVLPGGRSVNVHGDDIMIEPGQHVVHAHIRTRLAVWYLVTGQFGDLRATCNWAVALGSEGMPEASRD